MANNSIKGKFRELYQEVEENLSEESKNILKSLMQLNQKALHLYRNNLLKLLEDEYSAIIKNLANEKNISVDEVEFRMIGNLWDNYSIAIEKFNEPIHKYRSEEELNKEFEGIFEPIRNQTEEEQTFWSELRSAINGYDDDEFTAGHDDNEFEDNDNEMSVEESRLNSLALEIEENLQEELTVAVRDVKEKLNITFQVIDFFLEIYDIGKQMIFGF